MRVISFNVNGIRAISQKGKDGKKIKGTEINVLESLTEEQSPDIICLQEIKTQNSNDLTRYTDLFPHIYVNVATSKKGYSGVAILSKTDPLDVYENFGEATEKDLDVFYSKYDFIHEGRMLTAYFPTFTLICVYTPNSKDELVRLDERLIWDKAFRNYVIYLETTRKLPVIVAGDLNCAYADIDIHNSKSNLKSPGFSKEERDSFNLLISTTLTDTFRDCYPSKVKYSYWSMIRRSRESNRGWRIDYILVSSGIDYMIPQADILNDYYGSDHCPVIADIIV